MNDRLEGPAPAETATDHPETTETGARPQIREALAGQLDFTGQYAAKPDMLRAADFLDEGEALPTLEEIMSTFTPEELEIAGEYEKPRLVLVPDNSFAAKVKALNACRHPMKKGDTYVHPGYEDSDSGPEEATGWRAFIVNGKLLKANTPEAPMGERERKRKKTRKEHERGMERHTRAMLTLETMANGDPIDQAHCVILDDDPLLSDTHVPYAGFDTESEELSFYLGRATTIDNGTRFCSSVGGHVLIPRKRSS